MAMRPVEVGYDVVGFDLDEARVKDWLARGAQPTDTVKKLLRTQGIAG